MSSPIARNEGAAIERRAGETRRNEAERQECVIRGMAGGFGFC
jgi:hypothetical protein